jgi:hypothetical protein
VGEDSVQVGVLLFTSAIRVPEVSTVSVRIFTCSTLV